MDHLNFGIANAITVLLVAIYIGMVAILVLANAELAMMRGVIVSFLLAGLALLALRNIHVNTVTAVTQAV